MKSVAIAVFADDQRIHTQIERIRRSDQCHLAAIVDPTAQHAELAGEHQCHWFADVAALIRSDDDKPSCQAMWICPSAAITAAEVTQAATMAMLAGIPVLIDSDAIASLDMACELGYAATVTRSLHSQASLPGSLCCISQSAPFNPLVERLKRGLCGHASIEGNLAFPTPQSLFSRINLGLHSADVQPLLHMVAVVRQLAGPIAEIRTEHMQPLNIHAQSTAASGQLRLAFAAGNDASLTLTSHETDALASESVAINQISVTTQLPNQPATRTSVALSMNLPMSTADSELRYFCQQVSRTDGENHCPLVNDVAEFITNLEIVQAIFRSAISGKTQQVLPAIHEKPEITGTL